MNILRFQVEAARRLGKQGAIIPRFLKPLCGFLDTSHDHFDTLSKTSNILGLLLDFSYYFSLHTFLRESI